MNVPGPHVKTGQNPNKNWSFSAMWAIAVRPTLWIEGMLGLGSMTKGGRVSQRYLAWRSTTAYGQPQPVVPPDLVEYLAWRKRMRGMQ